MLFCYCWCSLAKPHPNFCDPMDCSTPGYAVLHYLPDFDQTHAHWGDDAIQPFHNLLPSSPLSLIFPASGSFPVRQPFALQGQSIGASVSVFPMNIQGWFLLGLTGLISAVQGAFKRILQHHNLKASILWHSVFLMVQHSHPHMTTGKTIALTIQTFSVKWCLCFLIHCLGLSHLSFQGTNIF